MKILIAAGIYPPDAGGPAVHAKAQFEGFRKLGMKTGLVTSSRYRHWPKGIRHSLYFLALLAEVPFYDVVYAHDALGSGIPALIAARIFGRKFMVRIGGDVVWERETEETDLSMKEWYEKGLHLHRLSFRMARWLMKHADLVVTTSPIMIELYTHYYGISNHKVKLLENPTPEVGDLVTKKGSTIIFASRLTKYKNLAFVLHILSEIFPNNPELRFVIMGNGPEENNLKKLTRELKIENNVVFAGVVSLEEVLHKTAECLFVIAPALTEFNPNYVLQGIALGKPFLISREHGLPFSVSEDFLFDPKDEDELKNKIQTLLEPSHYEKMVQEVGRLNHRSSWDDNLRMNKDFIMGLFNKKSQ
ncbi:MAG: glycosyltransferase [Candidatus Zambryskibacteria bacterium]|nr:glycosyltransferase [Candidatus Zambryskibacteria bacterium]